MATTTPNYGWAVPTSTDLVKDGAVAIETLGDSIDATTKALNPSTTLGDIEYRSSTANTNTRLGIGSTGQVLTVASGVPSWATPSAGGGGKLGQCLSTTKTDTFSASITAGSNSAVTGLSQAITPSASTSKILVTLTMNGYGANSGQFAGFIARGSTAIGVGGASGSRVQVASSTYGDSAHTGSITMSFLDSPATTSSVTYNGYVANTQPSTRTVFVNRTENDLDQQDMTRNSSTITVMEILA